MLRWNDYLLMVLSGVLWGLIAYGLIVIAWWILFAWHWAGPVKWFSWPMWFSLLFAVAVFCTIWFGEDFIAGLD